MKYTNQLCPVCKQLFNDEDDIVVCPDCGTPHHRNCYFENGGCANEALHGTGFVNKPIVNEITETQTEEPIVPEDEFEQAEDNFQREQEARQNVIRDIADDIQNKTAEQILIDGNSASYYEAAVGKNPRYYIPRFLILERTERKVMWNNMAFFFPLAWTLYRKLYKINLAVLAVYFVILASTGFIIFSNTDYMNAFNKMIEVGGVESMQNVMDYMNGNDVTLTAEQSDFVKVANDGLIPTYFSYGVYFCILAIRILLALFANKLYLEKLKKQVQKALAYSLDSESIKSFLNKKNGVLPMFIAVLAGLIDWAFFAGI